MRAVAALAAVALGVGACAGVQPIADQIDADSPNALGTDHTRIEFRRDGTLDVIKSWGGRDVESGRVMICDSTGNNETIVAKVNGADELVCSNLVMLSEFTKAVGSTAQAYNVPIAVTNSGVWDNLEVLPDVAGEIIKGLVPVPIKAP